MDFALTLLAAAAEGAAWGAAFIVAMRVCGLRVTIAMIERASETKAED